jgi:hypothetical protein
MRPGSGSMSMLCGVSVPVASENILITDGTAKKIDSANITPPMFFFIYVGKVARSAGADDAA